MDLPARGFFILCSIASQFFSIEIDEKTCVSCGKCARTCKMDVDITKNNAALECIRCGECIKVCPVHAIDAKLLLINKKIEQSEKVATAKHLADQQDNSSIK